MTVDRAAEGRLQEKADNVQDSSAAPALIQPHGMMLVADRDGRITHVSANFAVRGYRDAASTLGQTVASVLGADIAEATARVTASANVQLPETAFVGTLPSLAVMAPVQVSAHAFDGRTIIDIEPNSPDELDVTLPLLWLYRLQDDMRLANSSRAIGQSLATALQGVTGYDRMLVYEFDQDWHGHVIGEAQADGVPPLYLDMYFPASDISESRRTAYTRQRLRIIVDSLADGVALLADPSQPPLDLTFASLRSVSPGTAEYLRGRGVRASMIAAIMVGDGLWGLVVGKHYQGPRVPSSVARKAIQFAALLAGGMLSTLALATKLRLAQTVNDCIDRIAVRPDGVSWAQAVVREYPVLSAELELDGMSVQIAGEWLTAGAAVPHPRSWDEADPLLLTERFPHAVMPMRLDGDIVGGALFRIDDTPADVVLLGRNEYARSLKWGGDPNQAVASAVGLPARHGVLKSLGQWIETVQGRCRAFNRPEAAAIVLLQQRLTLMIQADKELQRQERSSQTERLSAIGLVAGGVAHDLNNMLGVISLNLELAMEYVGNNPAEPHLEAALMAVDNGARVTSALLSFARKQALKPVDIDPRHLLPEFASMAKVLLGQWISINTDCPDDIGSCKADLAQLQTALLNLTVNARDAMKSSGGIITVSARNLTVRTPLPAVGQDVRPGRYVAFAVADRGMGMPPDILRQAAVPFFTTKPEGVGTGLGLPMVFGFAIQSGGALTIESQPERGTLATILIPRTKFDPVGRVGTPG